MTELIFLFFLVKEMEPISLTSSLSLSVLMLLARPWRQIYHVTKCWVDQEMNSFFWITVSWKVDWFKLFTAWFNTFIRVPLQEPSQVLVGGAALGSELCSIEPKVLKMDLREIVLYQYTAVRSPAGCQWTPPRCVPVGPGLRPWITLTAAQHSSQRWADAVTPRSI